MRSPSRKAMSTLGFSAGDNWFCCIRRFLIEVQNVGGRDPDRNEIEEVFVKPKIAGRTPKITDTQNSLLLEWKAHYREVTIRKLSIMHIFHMREKQEPAQSSFSFLNCQSAESAYVLKIARASRSVIFTADTARASVRRAQACNRLLCEWGGSEYAVHILYGDETTFLFVRYLRQYGPGELYHHDMRHW